MEPNDDSMSEKGIKLFKPGDIASQMSTSYNYLYFTAVFVYVCLHNEFKCNHNHTRR